MGRHKWLSFCSIVQFLGFNLLKTNRSRGKTVSAILFVDLPTKWGDSTQKGYLTSKQQRKRQEDFITTCTSVVYAADIGQFSCLCCPPLFHSRVVFFRVFISALFLYFLQMRSYVNRSFAETFLPVHIIDTYQGWRSH